LRSSREAAFSARRFSISCSMLADDDDGACPSAEVAKNADNANTAEHP